MTDDVHPYFTDKARAAFTRRDGDPNNAGPLAQWAQSHATTGRPSADGVIVAATGEILADTRHTPSTLSSPGATYVRSVVHDSDREQVGREVGLACAALQRVHGPAVHISFSEVCRGPRGPRTEW